jgi:predicted dehydrogenase
MSGYPQELEDFIDCLLGRKDPISGLAVAEDTMNVIYSGYLSAEKGQRVDLNIT